LPSMLLACPLLVVLSVLLGWPLRVPPIALG
jgi:hypothetical protein